MATKCRMQIVKSRFRWNLLRFRCINPEHDHLRNRYGLSPDDVLVDTDIFYKGMTGRG